MVKCFGFGVLCAAAGLLGMTLPSVAAAGAVFRCTGPQGEIAITNKPNGYAACTKLPNSDYADPVAARARKPVVKEEPAKAIAATGPEPGKPGATQPDASRPAPVAAVEAERPRSEYKSMPASQFADVISETRLNGELQVETVGSKTERSNPSPRFRRAEYIIYKVAHANGIYEYTNVPSGSGPRTVATRYVQRECFACDVKSTINFGTLALITDAYKDEVATAASDFGVDQALLRAVIHAESAFNPNAISVKGAQGLMQLMPATASDMGVASPFDPAQNIRGGARYLAMLLRLFNGDERLAAAAYNSGPQNVQKYSGVPPFDETRVYVERVATLRKRYGEAR